MFCRNGANMGAAKPQPDDSAFAATSFRAVSSSGRLLVPYVVKDIITSGIPLGSRFGTDHQADKTMPRDTANTTIARPKRKMNVK
jgi:hypothetical protein